MSCAEKDIVISYWQNPANGRAQRLQNYS